VWANPDKTKTPCAIVYLHGFSATRQETAPLSDLVAAQLGAYLYYTRLAGHGRGGEAMAEPYAND
jgi:esterase/lipase